jgi:predicted Fe-Mo cluster-binding NifX family protein
MIIAIPSEGEDINSPISKVFARAPYFIIYDSEANTYRVVHNPEEAIAGPGATERVIAEGTVMVIANKMGRYSLKALRDNGIEVITGARGTCWGAIEKYRSRIK